MIIEILKMACILIAAIIIGNWFMSELKKSRQEEKPWYSAYLSLPGILILIAILLLPVLAWLF